MKTETPKKNIETNQTTIALNYNMFKERCEDAEKNLKKITKTLIKLIPRNILIEVLKKMKIIESDWERGNNKYKLKELN